MASPAPPAVGLARVGGAAVDAPPSVVLRGAELESFRAWVAALPS
ncbi:hypothetical protein [Frigoribacterium sp. R86507]